MSEFEFQGKRMFEFDGGSVPGESSGSQLYLYAEGDQVRLGVHEADQSEIYLSLDQAKELARALRLLSKTDSTNKEG